MKASKKLIVPKNLSLFPFQEELVRKQVSGGARYIYNACDMGTGKTVQALTYANTTKCRNILIICPAVVTLNWVKEANKWYTLRPNKDAQAILSGKHFSKLIKEPNKDYSPLVVSYSLLVRNEKVRNEILGKTWDLVILDEFHECKSISAKRTQIVCKDIWPICKRVYMMSGTPLTNSAADLFPFLYKVRKESNDLTEEQVILCSDFEDFTNRYTYKYVYKGEPTYTGIRKHPEIKDMLDNTNVFFRVKKKDVLKDLPDKTYHEVYLDLSVPEAADEEVLNKFLRSFEAGKKMPSIPQPVMSLRRKLGELKSTCNQVYKYLENLLDHHKEPIIIAAHHKSVVKELKSRLKKYNPVVIDGSTSTVNKQKAVEDFQSGKSSVIIGNVQAAGVGITLTRSCNVIFLEYDFLPYRNEQFVDRAYRIGQKNNVTAHYMIASHEFDEQLVSNMIQKQKQISKVVT